jgi:hypothetical protein
MLEVLIIDLAAAHSRKVSVHGFTRQWEADTDKWPRDRAAVDGKAATAAHDAARSRMFAIPIPGWRRQ